MVTDLHLLFNKVLGLDERANELVALLALQVPHLRLVNDVGDLELLFLRRHLVLLIDELLTQDPLFVVKVEEHAEVLRQLIVLLSLDDTLDLTLLRHFLPHFINTSECDLRRLSQEAFLLFTVDLRLKVLLLPHLLAQQGLMMLIEFSRLPEGHLEATGLRVLIVIVISWMRGILKHALLDALAGFVGWSEVCSVKLSLALVCQDFIIQLVRFLLVSDRDEQVLLIELDRLELRGRLQDLCVLLRRDYAQVRLGDLLAEQCLHIYLFIFDL